MTRAGTLFLTTLLLVPLQAAAAGSESNQTANESSSVDAKGKDTAAQGAHPASPGTVGAMNNYSGGNSFTAPQPGRKNNPQK